MELKKLGMYLTNEGCVMHIIHKREDEEGVATFMDTNGYLYDAYGHGRCWCDGCSAACQDLEMKLKVDGRVLSISWYEDKDGERWAVAFAVGKKIGKKTRKRIRQGMDGYCTEMVNGKTLVRHSSEGPVEDLTYSRTYGFFKYDPDAEAHDCLTPIEWNQVNGEFEPIKEWS